MISLIINADDCGQSQKTNQQIEDFILKGKISSTTVMANRDDLLGAVELYKKYSERISFGVHLNLDSGRPILYQQEMLDFGYVKQLEDNSYVFTGQAKKERNKRLKKELQQSILNEFMAQINLLRDNGFNISHIDSHHSIHCGLAYLPIIPQVQYLSKINRIRRRSNIETSFKYRLISSAWNVYMRMLNRSIITTDYMGSVCDFIKIYTSSKELKKGVYEIMVHPGINSGIYEEENLFLKQTDFSNEMRIRLLKYNDL